MEHTFVDLGPETDYTVSLGVQGYDETQYNLNIGTTKDGPLEKTFLHAALKPFSDKIMLSCSDENGIGEGRYVVKRSIDGRSYQSAQEDGTS